MKSARQTRPPVEPPPRTTRRNKGRCRVPWREGSTLLLSSLLWEVLCCFSLGCLAAQPDENTERHLDRLRVDSSRLVDTHGRTVLLRGVNLSNSNKFPGPSGSFLPDWIDDSVFSDIASRGFNSVRFVVVWEAIEPQPGVYEDSYLEQVRRLVRLAASHGLYTVLDMHQDVFSRAYGGCGAPQWALPQWPFPYEPVEPWFLNYMRPVVLLAFERFWKDAGGIQSRFRDCWAHIARSLRDEEGIAGYDLLNEPYPGLYLLAPCRFDREALAPFIKRLVDRIRQEDPVRLVFFEPSAFRTNALAPFGFPSALPADLGEGLVFSPHFYDPIVTLTHRWDPSDAWRLEDAARDLVNEAERLHAPVWVGEWNVWENSVENGEAYLKAQLHVFDRWAVSWAFWEYNLDWPDCPFVTGSPNAWMAEALERPYPQRAAGTIEHLSFLPETGRFEMTIAGARGSEGDSLIFLPGRIYADRFEVRISDGAAWRFDTGRRILKVEGPPPGRLQTIGVDPAP